MQKDKDREWLDFNDIKASADVPTVLAEIGVLDGLQQRGKEISGWCPLGTKRHGKKDSFSVNVESKTFQCFACKKRGSILDFVAHFRNISLREAAVMVRDRMAGVKAPDQADGEMLDDMLDTPSDDDLGRVIKAESRNPYGHIDHEPEPDADAYLQITMTLRQALDRVKAGQIDQHSLVVVDVSTLRYIHAVTKNHAR